MRGIPATLQCTIDTFDDRIASKRPAEKASGGIRPQAIPPGRAHDLMRGKHHRKNIERDRFLTYSRIQDLRTPDPPSLLVANTGDIEDSFEEGA